MKSSPYTAQWNMLTAGSAGHYILLTPMGEIRSGRSRRTRAACTPDLSAGSTKELTNR
jgi:hypothetical protein